MGVKKKTRSNVAKKVVAGTKKPVSQKKKKNGILIGIGIFLAVCIIGSSIYGAVVSPSKGQCKEVITDFQTACNKLDANGVVKCMNPSMITTALNIGTALAGDEAVEVITNLLGSGLDLMGMGSEETVSQLFQSMEITPKRFGFPGKTRKVTCKASFGLITQYVDIYITKYHGDPYITKVKFSK